MIRMIQAAFAVLLMFTATVSASGGKVTFSRSTVTLSCPDEGGLFNERTFTTKDDVPIEYKCKTSNEFPYQFYVKGKTCDNCFELDASLFIGVIAADVVVSTILMIIIYKCNKKTSSDVAPHPAKSPVRAPGRAPPVPHPDYAPLNPNTRSMDTYSTVVTKMG